MSASALLNRFLTSSCSSFVLFLMAVNCCLRFLNVSLLLPEASIDENSSALSKISVFLLVHLQDALFWNIFCERFMVCLCNRLLILVEFFHNRLKQLFQFFQIRTFQCFSPRPELAEPFRSVQSFVFSPLSQHHQLRGFVSHRSLRTA